MDSLITIPNEKLLSVLGDRVTLKEAFAAANDVLLGAVQGIAELITRPGMINVDFADVRTVMSEKGRAMMGSGRGSGEDGARTAAETAMRCPLLEDINLSGARGILVNITARSDLGMQEVRSVGESVGEFASENALVVMGTALDESVGDEIRVTVVATGLGEAEQSSAQGNRCGSSPPNRNRLRLPLRRIRRSVAHRGATIAATRCRRSSASNRIGRSPCRCSRRTVTTRKFRYSCASSSTESPGPMRY